VTVGVGIVGCGGAAIEVAAAIDRSERARLVATHDLDTALATELAATAGATVHGSLDGLLDNPDVQAVYVALPHHLLTGVARRVLEANRPALVEKPMALTCEDLAGLSGLATSRNLALGVMFQLRHTWPPVAAREIVRAGRVGRVVQVRIQTLIDKPLTYWSVGFDGRSTGWRASRERAGGGVALMNSIHQIDLVHSITDQHIERISGEVATLVADTEVEDVAAAAFRLSGGAVGSLVASAHSLGAHAEESIDIDGTTGSVRLGDLYGTGWCRLWASGAWQELEPRPTDPHREALDGFLAAVESGQPAPVGAAEAGAALAAVLALYEDSARRNQP
jgi:predicted dehydrogenase